MKKPILCNPEPVKIAFNYLKGFEVSASPFRNHPPLKKSEGEVCGNYSTIPY